MSKLLTLPDELLLEIQAYLITRNDRFAFGAACQTLNAKVGGIFLYEQDVAEERDFDNARLRLERFFEEHRALVLDDETTDLEAWPEVLAAKMAKYSSEDEDNEGVCKFLQDCVDRWGPKMLCYTNRRDPSMSIHHRGPIRESTQFPSSQLSHTLLYRAIMDCNDIKVLGNVFDVYLNKYPVAIQGLKSGWLDYLPEGGWGNEPPVYLASLHNRVGALDLLHKKGVNINLVKGYLTLEGGGMRINRDQDRLDMLYDASDGVLRPDLWAWLRVNTAFNPRNLNRGFPEEVCLWLIENNLGISDRPFSLHPRDLVEAAVQGNVRLVVAMIKYFKPRLSPKEHNDALTSALLACNSEQPRYIGRWTREMLRLAAVCAEPVLRTPQTDIEVLEVLLKAGASLRQDPKPEERWGLLTNALTCRPSNVPWLLQQQIAAGVTDPRDLRVALLMALGRRGCSSDSEGDTGGQASREFFATIIPENAHLACNPSRITTPESREQAIQELFDCLIQFIDRQCYGQYHYDTALYFVETVGAQRVGAELAHRLELSAKGQLHFP